MYSSLPCNSIGWTRAYPTVMTEKFSSEQPGICSIYIRGNTTATIFRARPQSFQSPRWMRTLAPITMHASSANSIILCCRCSLDIATRMTSSSPSPPSISKFLHGLEQLQQLSMLVMIRTRTLLGWRAHPDHDRTM
ncbi:hypothetical protein VPH35_021942 [Triticum aestivum]